MDAKQEKQINLTIESLMQQRNNALNQLIQVQVEIMLLKEELESLKKNV